MTHTDYAIHGYVRLSGVIDRTAARQALDWLTVNRSRSDIAATRDMFDRSNTRPIKIRGLWSADPAFWEDFIKRCGVLPFVHEHLGDRFYLIRSAAFIKYPMTNSLVGWHCDEDLWGHPCNAGLTAWIPLTPAPTDSGCLQFVLGSHCAKHGKLYWDLRHPYHKVMDVTEMGATHAVSVDVGDCILMDKRTVHSSGANTTQQERVGLVMAFAVCAQEALNEPALAITQEQHLSSALA